MRIAPCISPMAGPRARAETCEGRLRGLAQRRARGRLEPGLALCTACSNPESPYWKAQCQIMDVELGKLDIRGAPQSQNPHKLDVVEFCNILAGHHPSKGRARH